MMRLLVVRIILAGALAIGARAAPFYLRYDADETFPEQSGFTRFGDDDDGRLVRSVENGVFTLDSRASFSIFDLYLAQFSAFDLEPDEELRVNWRMRTLETSGTDARSDVALSITNGDTAFVQLFLGTDFVSEDQVLFGDVENLYKLEPGVFHDFSWQTNDMRTYRLSVDGVPAFEGNFHNVALIGPRIVVFGDTFVGRTSLSEWDYVEIAVVPEPTLSLWLITLCALIHRSLQRSNS